MEVNLKKDGWYNKLQNWTLGNSKPDLFSLCPYFWLTIFCIIISPLTLIYKAIKYIAIKFDQKVIQTYFDRFVDSLNPKDVYTMKYRHMYTQTPLFKNRLKAYDMYLRWYDRMIANGKTEDEINKILDDARIEYQKYRSELEKKSDEQCEKERLNDIKNIERKRKMKIWWVPVVLWTRRLVTVFITLGLMVVLTLFINLIVENWDGGSVWGGLKTFLISVLYLSLFIGISYVIYLMIIWCIENKKFKPLTDFLCFIFIPVGQFFSYIYNGLKNTLSIFFEYFKANKNDYCPAINWGDDNDKDKK